MREDGISNSKHLKFSIYRHRNMFRQINCCDKNFYAATKIVALKHQNYVTTQDFDVATQNRESQNRIVATNISML